MRAAFYCRFGVLDVSQITSYDLAAALYRQMAENYGWSVAGVYLDHGRGNNSRDLLLKACEEGGIDLVVTRSIARFEADTRKLIALVDAFHSAQVGICFEDVDIYTLEDYQPLKALLQLIEQEMDSKAQRGFDHTIGDAGYDNKLTKAERSGSL